MKEQLYDLIYQAHAGNTQVRNQLVERNIGLVIDQIDISKDDEFQEGIIGLMKAIEGFDPDLGYEFSTYAVPIIRRCIKSYRMHDRTIQIPQYIFDCQSKFRTLKRENLMMSEEDVINLTSKFIKKSPTRIKELLGIGINNTFSMDVEYQGGDKIYDFPVENKNLYGSSDVKYFLSLIKNQRDKDIVSLLINGFKCNEVAKTYKVSRQRIQQIFKGAINKIKNKIKTQ